jgi:CRISPR-associated protein Cas1
VCLPEESRLALAVSEQVLEDEQPTPVRLFPPDPERRTLHVVSQRGRIGRSGNMLSLTEPDTATQKIGSREVSDVVIHGHAQITTQALRLCADAEIPVHWVTTSGAYLGAFAAHAPAVQRRIRQYRGLCDEAQAVALARRLIVTKIQLQLHHVLRASRKDDEVRAQLADSIALMRRAVSSAAHGLDRETLLGQEGTAARVYFQALPHLVHPDAGPDMRPVGRNRRPPQDRFNALLSFGYALLYRDLVSAILRVGLEPSFGLMHQPRSAAYPLALDLMELFRVPVVDMAVLGAVNRRTFDPADHFTITGKQVWLSDEGRRRLIAVYERRKHEEHRHPSVGYTLSYARMMELEVRLLEKEWSGEPGLFARLRIR